MTQHVLTEYTPEELSLPGQTVDALIERHRSHLTLAPLGKDQWLVTPRSFVGTISAGEHSFLIRPKVGLRNLLTMMDIAIPSEAWRREVAHLESDPDLLAVMARLFCVACEDTTRRGLRRSYVAHSERLVAARGRIDVSSIARHPGLPIPVPCRFDEHTSDIQLNRILRAAIERSRRTPSLPPAWKRRLARQLAEFDEAVTSVGNIDWVRRWDPAPMELHYETSVRLAHLILTRHSLLDQFGPSPSNTFLVNMNDLFEKWVGARLRNALGTDQLIEQHHSRLGTDGSVLIKPDLTVWRNSRCIAVADTKYKLLDSDGTGRAPDYYQALAYATAYDLRDAWLIYARFPGDPDSGSVPVVNSDKTLHTIGLDLTGPLENAVAQITTLAKQLVVPEQTQRPNTAAAHPVGA